MDLKCKKLDCVNNNKYSCSAKGINIKKNQNCQMFEKAEHLKECQKQDVSKTMFEVAPDMHPFRHNKKLNITCEANCLFNKDGICHANGISILKDKGSAFCATHIDV